MGISIPACCAAAQTSVPAGTATGMSSMVRCTNSSFFTSGIYFYRFKSIHPTTLACLAKLRMDARKCFIRYCDCLPCSVHDGRDIRIPRGTDGYYSEQDCWLLLTVGRMMY